MRQLSVPSAQQAFKRLLANTRAAIPMVTPDKLSRLWGLSKRYRQMRFHRRLLRSLMTVGVATSIASIILFIVEFDTDQLEQSLLHGGVVFVISLAFNIGTKWRLNAWRGVKQQIFDQLKADWNASSAAAIVNQLEETGEPLPETAG